jgi:acyl-CoA synthetase (AMP-forming)/AMP-acid ligase II/acyl carrier protein
MTLYDTMTDLLSDARGKARHIQFIDGEHDESSVTFGELWDRALALTGSLQARGMEPGDELVIFSKSNESFVVAFWAALLGGIVPVPVAVGISDEHRFKLFRIIKQLQRGTLFTEQDLLERLLEFSRQCELADVTAILETRSVLMSDVSPGDHGELATIKPSDPAFIQYSSGSTSDPKGVCLTHRNLCSNIRAIVEATHWMEDDQSLSWMPLTHDMGLIGYHLSVMAAGMNHAVMDTSVFVRRPLLWMNKTHELRATQLCSPNFGYKHFLKLFERKGLPEGTDLSCVKLILNGAEPISWDLCEDFLAQLAPFGLKHSAMYPVYGLAEATVGVTVGRPGDDLSRISVDRHSLRIGDSFVTATAGEPGAVSFLRVGKAIRDVEVRIADDDDTVLDDGKVGHIQLIGASVTERILGKVVVAGATPTGSGTEELLVFILYRQDLDAFAALAEQARNIIGEHVGLEVDHVIPVSRIPKTTSGKVQRAHLLRDYFDGEFKDVLSEMAPAAATDDGVDDDPLVAELEIICREFSKERKIGADDNLFEVGVSSLTLTEIVLAIDERYPGKLDISDLFDYPTLREVAAFLQR